MYGEASDGRAQTKLRTTSVEHPKNSSKSHPEIRTNAKKCVKTSTLICTKPGCQYRGSFSSKNELRRHVICIHNTRSTVRPFICGALGCLKGGQVTGFARADKLIAHLRKVHTKSTFLACPRDGCQQSPLDGLLMYVHVQSHVATLGTEQNALLKAVARACSPEFLQCPARQCRQNLLLHHVIDHLLDHGDAVIRSHSTALAELGLLYAPSVKEDAVTTSPIWDATIMDSQWAAPFMRIFVLCPLCNLELSSCVEFRAHLIDIHVHTQSPHFGIWITHVEETLRNLGYVPVDAKAGSTIRKLLREANVWTAWRFVLMNSHTVDVQFRCPACSAVESVAGNMTVVHHLSMLDCFAELLPHRRQILALCPQFASHPVFKDIRVSDYFEEPHAFRLRKVSTPKTTKALAAGTRSEYTGVVKAVRSESSNTGASHVDSHTPSSTSVVSKSLRHTLTGIGDQFRDPMIGGLEDVALSANDIGKLDAWPTSPKVVTFPNVGRVDEGIQASRDSTTTYQAYSHGKNHICGHIGCGLRFERPTELRLHQRAHQRPHRCRSCGKGFPYPKDRRRHEERIHPELPKESSSSAILNRNRQLPLL